MVAFLLVLTHSTKSDSLTEYRRLLTKDQSAIYSGLILMTDVVGVSAQEVLATPSVKTSQSSSIIRTTSQESQELISSLWTDTTGHTSETWSQSFRLQITATDVVMKLLSWKLMSLWNIICKWSHRNTNRIKFSLTFDPAPRQSEIPNISLRTPDYFLWLVLRNHRYNTNFSIKS